MPKYRIELEDGRKFDVEADSKPTIEELSAALGMPLDTGQGMAASLGNAAARGLATTFTAPIAGVGAIGEAMGIPGAEDLREFGTGLTESATAAFPVNPANEGIATAIAGGAGQGAGLLLSGGAIGLAGKGLGMTAAAAGNVASRAMMGIGVASGASEGGEMADRQNLSGVERLIAVLGTGGLEYVTEKLPFGMLAETSAVRRLVGDTPNKTISFSGTLATNTVEEVAANTGQNVLERTLAADGAEVPGVFDNTLHAAAGGLGGGLVFGLANAGTKQAQPSAAPSELNPQTVDPQQPGTTPSTRDPLAPPPPATLTFNGRLFDRDENGVWTTPANPAETALANAEGQIVLDPANDVFGNLIPRLNVMADQALRRQAPPPDAAAPAAENNTPSPEPGAPVGTDATNAAPPSETGDTQPPGLPEGKDTGAVSSTAPAGGPAASGQISNVQKVSSSLESLGLSSDIVNSVAPGLAQRIADLRENPLDLDQLLARHKREAQPAAQQPAPLSQASPAPAATSKIVSTDPSTAAYVEWVNGKIQEGALLWEGTTEERPLTADDVLKMSQIKTGELENTASNALLYGGMGIGNQVSKLILNDPALQNNYAKSGPITAAKNKGGGIALEIAAPPTQSPSPAPAATSPTPSPTPVEKQEPASKFRPGGRAAIHAASTPSPEPGAPVGTDATNTVPPTEIGSTQPPSLSEGKDTGAVSSTAPAGGTAASGQISNVQNQTPPLPQEQSRGQDLPQSRQLPVVPGEQPAQTPQAGTQSSPLQDPLPDPTGGNDIISILQGERLRLGQPQDTAEWEWYRQLQREAANSPLRQQSAEAAARRGEIDDAKAMLAWVNTNILGGNTQIDEAAATLADNHNQAIDAASLGPAILDTVNARLQARQQADPTTDLEREQIERERAAKRALITASAQSQGQERSGLSLANELAEGDTLTIGGQTWTTADINLDTGTLTLTNEQGQATAIDDADLITIDAINGQALTSSDPSQASDPSDTPFSLAPEDAFPQVPNPRRQTIIDRLKAKLGSLVQTSYPPANRFADLMLSYYAGRASSGRLDANNWNRPRPPIYRPGYATHQRQYDQAAEAVRQAVQEAAQDIVNDPGYSLADANTANLQNQPGRVDTATGPGLQAQTQAPSLPSDPASRIEAVNAALRQHLGLRRLSPNVQIVHSTAPVTLSDGSRRQWKARVRSGRIEINAANITSEAEAIWNLEHELAHEAFRDSSPTLKRAWNRLTQAIANHPDIRAEVEALRYTPDQLTEEQAVRLAQKLDAQGPWTEAWQALKEAVFNFVTGKWGDIGTTFTDRISAALAARSIMADARARLAPQTEAEMAAFLATAEAAAFSFQPSDLLPDGTPKPEVLAEIAQEKADIEARAKADGTWMKAPNGQPSNLNKEQWVAVRTRRFKEWFGDWEAASLGDFIKGPPVATLTGQEFARDPSKPLSERVAEWFQSEHGGNVNRADIGPITLNAKGVKDSWMHGQSAKKAAAFAAVPAIIQQGRIIRRQPNYKPGVERIIIAAPVTIAGKQHTGLVIVQRANKTQRFYLHEVFTQETKMPRTSSTARAFGKTGKRSGTDAEALHSVADNLLAVNPDSTSKVVDENGEPLVVFHGTPKRFNKFDQANAGNNTGNEGLFGAGHYFALDQESAKSYGDVIVQGFLNIRNPANIPDSMGTMMKGEDSADYWTQFEADSKAIINRLLKANGYTSLTSYRVDESFLISFANAVESATGSRPQIDATPQMLQGSLRMAGFDGVMAIDGSAISEIVAHDPTQIKSATANVGTFSNETSDIRYSLAEDSPAPASPGRAQPLDAPVLTPTGYRPIGSLAIGDDLASTDGTPSTVTGVYPQGRKQVFKITLADGRTIRATEDHLWQAQIGSLRSGYTTTTIPVQTRTLAWNMGKGLKVKLPVAPTA